MSRPPGEHPRLPVWRPVLLLLLVLLPFVVCGLSSWSAGTGWLYSGALPVLIAVARGGRRAPALTAAATATGVLLGGLAGRSTWGAIVVVGSAAAVVGLSARVGWNDVGCVVAPQVAQIAVASRVLVIGGERLSPGTPTYALAATALVLVGGVWIAAVAALRLVDPPVRAEPPRPLSPGATALFTGQLVLLTGVGTWVVRELTSAANAWWLLLTFFVVLLPDRERSLRRVRDRVVGTVGGGLVGIVLVGVVPVRGVLLCAGLLAAIATALTYVRGQYVVFSAALTTTLVLAGASGSAQVFSLTTQRIGFTVLGAVCATVLLLADGRRARDGGEVRFRRPAR